MHRKVKVKVTQSCPTLCDPMDYTVHGILQARIPGSPSLLQGIFPTQGSNPGLPHGRQILYQLSHKGSPRILEWVACPFSSGSSWSGIKSGSPTLQADSLPTELSGMEREIIRNILFTWFHWIAYLNKQIACTPMQFEGHGPPYYHFRKPPKLLLSMLKCQQKYFKLTIK